MAPPRETDGGTLGAPPRPGRRPTGRFPVPPTGERNQPRDRCGAGRHRGTLRSVMADPGMWRGRSIGGVPLGDAVLAAGVAAFALLDVLLSPDWRGPRPVDAVVVVGAAVSLAWRRRAPLAVLAVVVTCL